MTEPSGPMWPVPFAIYDPDGSCWRTSRESLPLENLPEPSVTWPAQGMTRDGYAYELPRPERHMDASGASSLLPTPVSRDWKDTGDFTPHPEKVKLPHTIAALFPTPGATDGTKGGPNQRGSSEDLMLPSAVMLLPTPMTSYSQRSAEEWRQGRPAGNGQTRELIGDLEIVAKEAAAGRLSTGAGTHLPSTGGNTSPDDEHQLPLFPDEPGNHD